MAGIQFWGGRDPGVRAVALTEHDTNTFEPTRAIWVGAAGDLTVRLRDDSANTVWLNVPAGTLLPISIKLLHTDTTALSIVGIY